MIKCQFSPVLILNIIKKELPKLRKLTVSELRMRPVRISLKREVAKMARMRKSRKRRDKTFNMAGKSRKEV